MSQMNMMTPGMHHANTMMNGGSANMNLQNTTPRNLDALLNNASTMNLNASVTSPSGLNINTPNGNNTVNLEALLRGQVNSAAHATPQTINAALELS
jgi:hypothetical protein